MITTPEEGILLQLNTVFKDGLTTKQITDAIERIVRTIQTEFPRIRQIFVEPVPNQFNLLNVTYLPFAKTLRFTGFQT